MMKLGPNPRSQLKSIKKVRSETHLVGGSGGVKGGDKDLYIQSLEAQVDDLQSRNDSLTTRLQLLREHNAKLKIKLMEKEQEIKSLLLKQLDSGTLSGGLPSPVQMDESPAPPPNGKRKKKKGSPAPPERSSTFNLLNADPDGLMEGTDLVQSTTEVIVDGVEYKDFSEDEEEYDDSLEENGGGLKMSTSSTPLSLVAGNRRCAACGKDIVGRAVRNGNLVYHKRCHDKHVVGTM